MMSRLGRFRKTDAFAVVGIFMLLVWTPGYVAQDDDARAFSRGGDFVVPERRVGDSITYALVIEEAGEVPRTIGPVQRITFERAGPDAAPVPAAFVETRTTYSWSETVGGLRFEALPFEDRQYFAENGSLVWRALRVVQEPDDDGASRFTEVGVRTAAPKDHALERFDGPVQFEPSSLAATAIKLGRDIVAEFSGPPHADLRLLSDRVAVLDGDTFYAILSARDAAARVEEALTGERTTRAHGDDGLVRLALRIPNTQLTTTDGRAVVGEAAWLWASPASARPVGSHDRVRDADGTVYDIDIVALDRVAGDGPVVPWVHIPERPLFEPSERHALPPRTDVTWTPLSNVERDQVPVFGNASLADLRAMLAENGPQALQDALASGSRIVEFLLEPGVRTHESEGSETSLLPDPLATVDEILVQRSNWTLGLVGPQGATSVAHMWLEERPGPRFAAVVEDACTGAEPHDACGIVWSEGIDWSRQVVAPGAMAAAAVDDADEPGHLRHYAPLASCARYATASSALERPTCRHLIIHTLGDGSNMEWSSHRHETSGKATWRSTAPDGAVMQYDLVDGHADGRWKERPAAPSDAEPPSPTSRSLSAPVPLEVVGTHAAWGGFGLLLASVAFRLGAALKSGAHLPFLAALFSRISKADALLHERRSDIVELLRSDPGLTAQEVARRLGYSRTATIHHLETLMRTGQLLYVQNGQQRHYFPPDGTERERVRLAVVRDESYANLLGLVDAAPGITLAELTEQTGRSKSRLSRMTARLVRLGVLRRERDGRTLRLFPASSPPTS